eukprot:1752871-Rhodomonas_salina.3
MWFGGGGPSPDDVAVVQPLTIPQQPTEGHFNGHPGLFFEKTTRHPKGRYQIVRELGSGVYGRVFECTDHEQKGGNVAIKAVRAEQAYREAAKREIVALQMVGVHDNVCRMLRHFDEQGHICI